MDMGRDLSNEIVHEEIVHKEKKIIIKAEGGLIIFLLCKKDKTRNTKEHWYWPVEQWMNVRNNKEIQQHVEKQYEKWIFSFTSTGTIHTRDGGWEPQQHDRVHHLGLNRGSCTGCSLLCAISRHRFLFLFLFLLHCHISRQFQNNCSNKNLSPAPHPHVPVPQPSAFCRHCVFNISLGSNAYGAPWAWTDHPCGWLWSPALYYSVIWVIRMLPARCHGLWALCVHLFPAALLHTYVLQHLFFIIGNFLCRWLHEWLDIYWMFVKSVLVWTKSDRSLFLWLLPLVETFLLRYLHHWNYPLHLFWFHHCDHSDCHRHLPHLHPHHHPEDALYWGPSQDLFHLHLPPHWSHSLLWNHYRHLCDAQVQLLHWTEQGAVSALHSDDPHVESPPLQFEEQRYKGSSEEGNYQIIFIESLPWIQETCTHFSYLCHIMYVTSHAA